MREAEIPQRRYERLRLTRTLRDDGIGRWCSAMVAVVGAGNLGGRTALEIVMSGGKVNIYDPDVGAIENQATQWVEPGVPKAATVAAVCNNIRSGTATGVQADIRQIGVGEVAQCALLIDCSDSAAITPPLTRLTNGIGMPMLRGALAGDGKSELGRVQFSHGGGGHSCAMCTYSAEDLFRGTENMPCSPSARRRPPTLAGGAMGAMVAGALTLSAQRLITGNDAEEIIDHELILDMTGGQFLRLMRRRSPHCLSGHRRWSLTPVPLAATGATMADVFRAAERCLSQRVDELRPYGHPLCVEAICECGQRQPAVGTRWAPPPRCGECGSGMAWRRESALPTVSRADITALGIESVSLVDLGLPERGAMFTAAVADRSSIHVVLK